MDSWDLCANNFTFESVWRKLIVKEDVGGTAGSKDENSERRDSVEFSG